MVAILRGLGYAGAYLGGDHQADHIRWIIRRSETLASRWEEFAEQFTYAPRGGFYFYETPRSPAKNPEMLPRVLDALGRLFPVNNEGKLRKFLTGIFRWIDRRPGGACARARGFVLKSALFVSSLRELHLGKMEYVCPMTCPRICATARAAHLNGRCGVVISRASGGRL
jgi:hypothetical protein